MVINSPERTSKNDALLEGSFERLVDDLKAFGFLTDHLDHCHQESEHALCRNVTRSNKGKLNVREIIHTPTEVFDILGIPDREPNERDH